MDSIEFWKHVYLFGLYLLLKIKHFFIWIWELKFTHKVYLFLIILAIFDNFRTWFLIWILKIISWLL